MKFGFSPLGPSRVTPGSGGYGGENQVAHHSNIIVDHNLEATFFDLTNGLDGQKNKV